MDMLKELAHRAIQILIELAVCGGLGMIGYVLAHDLKLDRLIASVDVRWKAEPVAMLLRVAHGHIGGGLHRR